MTELDFLDDYEGLQESDHTAMTPDQAHAASIQSRIAAQAFALTDDWAEGRDKDEVEEIRALMARERFTDRDCEYFGNYWKPEEADIPHTLPDCETKKKGEGTTFPQNPVSWMIANESHSLYFVGESSTWKKGFDPQKFSSHEKLCRIARERHGIATDTRDSSGRLLSVRQVKGSLTKAQRIAAKLAALDAKKKK